jgi:hypothetical protein
MKREDSDYVSVTWGEEKCSIKGEYSTFTVGPFSMTTKVKPGETPEEAMERAQSYLDAHARKVFTRKRDAFLQELRGIAAKVR